MKRIIPVFCIIACVASAGCNSQSKPFTDQRLIVAAKTTVKVPGLNMTITNNGCGRKWVSDGDQPSYEKAYCELVIQRGDIKISTGHQSKPDTIGDVEVEIDRMNPWGREEDSVPAGGCRVWIRRIVDPKVK